jgi:hypothetical protein
MLKISTNKSKTVNFEIELAGVESSRLIGSLRIILDGIEYGFPAKISEKYIKVEIPPLRDVVKKSFREGEEINARLDVVSEDFYLNPWSGSFTVSSPMKVEVKLLEDNSKSLKVKVSDSEKEETRPTKKLKFTKIVREQEQKPKIKKESITEQMVYDYIASKGTKNEKIQDIMYNQTCKTIGSSEPYDILKSLIKFYKK